MNSTDKKYIQKTNYSILCVVIVVTCEIQLLVVVLLVERRILPSSDSSLSPPSSSYIIFSMLSIIVCQEWLVVNNKSSFLRLVVELTTSLHDNIASPSSIDYYHIHFFAHHMSVSLPYSIPPTHNTLRTGDNIQKGMICSVV